MDHDCAVVDPGSLWCELNRVPRMKHVYDTTKTKLTYERRVG